MGSENAGTRWFISHTSAHYVTSLSLAAELPVIISTAKWHTVVMLSNTISINRCYADKYSTQCSHICVIKNAPTNMFRGQLVFSDDIENSRRRICSSFQLSFLLCFPAEASSSSLAGILSTIGVAIVGAVTGYFTYQKKKLCFKNRQGNYLAQ